MTKELEQREITTEGIAKIKDVISVEGSNEEKLDKLAEIMGDSEQGKAGVQELRDTLKYHNTIKNSEWTSEVLVDISLARGLNYYTGVIVEVVCDAVKMGSIGGGGRYDDLTGLFGLKNTSGVGVSFGVERVYDVMEELGLYPDELSSGIQAIIINFGGEDEMYALKVLTQLREAGINAEIYPDAAKFDKQMKYANKRNVPYVIIIGEEERNNNTVSLKNFTTGEQEAISVAECINTLK